MLRVLSFLCLVFVGSSLSAEPLDTLKPIGYVNDNAGLLTSTETDQLEQRLRQVSSENGAEIVVLTLKSLDGSTVEMAARKVFDNWRIGKSGVDNGVLLLIAMKERAIRIETGYGAETKIPDLVAGRIIRETIAPKLKRKEHYSGISDGVTALMKRVDATNLEGEQEDGKEAGIVVMCLYAFAWLAIILFISPLGPAAILAFRKKDVRIAVLGSFCLALLGFIGAAIALGFSYILFRVILIVLTRNSNDTSASNPFNYPIFRNRGGWGGGSGGGFGGFGGFGGGGGGGGGASGRF